MPPSPVIRFVIIGYEPAIRKDMQVLMQQQPGFIVPGVCGSVQDISPGDGTGFAIGA